MKSLIIKIARLTDRNLFCDDIIAYHNHEISKTLNGNILIIIFKSFFSLIAYVFRKTPLPMVSCDTDETAIS